jgi:hypothetical protein
MRRRNLLLIACVAMMWSGAAAAQATPQGGAQTTHGAQNQSAAPATNAGTPSTAGAQTPVRQPNTSPPPSAPPPAPANTSPPPSAPTPAPANTSPPPSTPTQGSSSMPQQAQQTVVPNAPNAGNNPRDTTNNPSRARVATQTDTVPPASRGVGQTGNRPDCSQMRGIEKSECERRDTSRDDLPAGVTTTQPPQPNQQPQPPR